MTTPSDRTIGLLGATAIGVGAIVGGGILALAGVAFAAAGPSAMVAFILNGIIAVLTALSFAEMSAAFPQSGGTYTFAKKVLNVRSAFTMGWIVWFASIVAGVLYALGFAFYAVIVLEQLHLALAGPAPGWLTSRIMVLTLALGATGFYTWGLLRSTSGGGAWATYGKVLVFGVLIAGGLWAVVGTPSPVLGERLEPFFAGGSLGVLAAMGFTFIAFQGFDLIAAAAGEIKNPARVIPRAMLLSLAIALVIYLPLLFIIATVGVQPGETIQGLSIVQPETIVAVATQNFLGSLGFWLVVVAAVLSMLSALQANLFAASRIALAMARDRTLPRQLGKFDERHGTPVPAVLASAGTLVLLLLLIPDVAAAGAAASLIFLVTFALVHWISFLARQRMNAQTMPFRVPFFPLVPIVGGLACAGLAVFQGFAVPAAGIISSVWIGVGLIIYLTLLAQRARAMDAFAEARDPQLVQLRGRTPLVLVPVANPANAAAMVEVGSALAPPTVGRVLLLSVVTNNPNPNQLTTKLENTQLVLRESLQASFNVGLYPEALTTVATEPWDEISRVSRAHGCESMLLGLSNLNEPVTQRSIDDLMSNVDCDVVVLRAPEGWQLSEARRVLVPIGGRGTQDILRARLLGSLGRNTDREVTYLNVAATTTSPAALRNVEGQLERLAEDETRGEFRTEVIQHDDALSAITARAKECDLMILGLPRQGRRQKQLGAFALELARNTTCAIIMISRRG